MRLRKLVPTFVLTIASLLLTVPAVTAQTPTPAGATTTVNLELILDASGSMAELLPDGQTRIEAAKQALNEVIDSLPVREGVNVGFRVYGHKGNNTETGKSLSCQSTELKVPMNGVDKDALRAQVQTYEPVGWTPIALSLREAGKDFPPAEEGVVNAVLLVTDGLETCGGNPCTASRELKNGPSAITTHVIGFALSEDEQANLQCIVDESGGLLLGAGNTQELTDALFAVLEELEVVVRDGFLEIESIGGLFPKATIDGLSGPNDSNPNAKPFTLTLTDQNKVELPAGKYHVHWTNPSGQETGLDVQIEAEKTTVIRGSVLRFPHGAGEVYILKDIAGTEIWHAPIEIGDVVWLLPGTYRLELAEITGDAVLLSMDVQTLPGSLTEIQVLTAP